MMSIQKFFVLLALVILLGACNRDEMLERFASKEEQAVAMTYIDRLRAHDFDALAAEIDPSIMTEDMHSLLERMAAGIPPGEPTSRKLVGVNIRTGTGWRSLNTTFEYGFGEQWVLTNVALKVENGKTTIVGISAAPQDSSIEEQTRFTLVGKSVGHHAILVLTIAVALLSLIALVVCVRTRLPGRKWPWVLFIILGVGQLSLNWSTGELAITPLALQLFSAGAMAEFYGPWVISLSIPLGAIVFLVYRKRLLVKPPAGPSSTTLETGETG